MQHRGKSENASACEGWRRGRSAPRSKSNLETAPIIKSVLPLHAPEISWKMSEVMSSVLCIISGKRSSSNWPYGRGCRLALHALRRSHTSQNICVQEIPRSGAIRWKYAFCTSSTRQNNNPCGIRKCFLLFPSLFVSLEILDLVRDMGRDLSWCNIPILMDIFGAASEWWKRWKKEVGVVKIKCDVAINGEKQSNFKKQSQALNLEITTYEYECFRAAIMLIIHFIDTEFYSRCILLLFSLLLSYGKIKYQASNAHL